MGDSGCTPPPVAAAWWRGFPTCCRRRSGSSPLRTRDGCSPSYLGLPVCRRQYAHLLAPVLGVWCELHGTCGQRKDRKGAAQTNVRARVDACAALPHYDRARQHQLAIIALHPQPLAMGIAAVLGAAPALLVC